MKRYALVIPLVVALGGCATMSDAWDSSKSWIAGFGVPVKSDGDVLVNSDGMTLYTFDRDPVGGGKSLCNRQCAASWPPLMAREDARASGDYNVIRRSDGAKQWAYKGKPLYLWVKDTKPGDKSGDGLNKVWHVAQP